MYSPSSVFLCNTTALPCDDREHSHHQPTKQTYTPSHLNNDKELLSRLALRDNILTLLEGAGLQSISNS